VTSGDEVSGNVAKPEITRFKGLGEISPKEFAQFIGKEMVLAHGHHVEYPPRRVRPDLQLLHGQEHARAPAACLKIRSGAVWVAKAGWRGATKFNTLHGSWTAKQRS
jgi:hypothetical protein